MIGIICAMDVELALYKKLIKDIKLEVSKHVSFFTGKIGENDVVLTECGIGKVNSTINASLLIQLYNPTLIINTGIAGGVNPLQTSNIFIADNFVYGDFDLRVFNYKFGQVPNYEQFFTSSSIHTTLFKDYLTKSNIDYSNGLIITQDSFIKSLEQISEFKNNKIATDMEGASLAHVCKFYNIPFFSIRIISDIINSDEQISNYSEFESAAASLSSKVTFEFLLTNKL